MMAWVLVFVISLLFLVVFVVYKAWYLFLTEGDSFVALSLRYKNDRNFAYSRYFDSWYVIDVADKADRFLSAIEDLVYRFVKGIVRGIVGFLYKFSGYILKRLEKGDGGV